MKIRRVICWVLALILLLGLIGPVFAEETQPQETTTATAPPDSQPSGEPTAPGLKPGEFASGNAPVLNGCSTLDAQVPLRSERILKTAEAALLYEVNGDTIVYGHNMDMKIYPGSLVKIMTMLIALENIEDSKEKITITQADLDAIPAESNNMGILLDEELTYEDLFYGMILYSGNDTAVAIARHVSGTEAEFVNLMNKRAKELGCTATNFVNVHGIHDENQYTTPRDLARIMNRAIEFELFRQVMGTEIYIMDPTNKEEERYIYSRNYMLGQLLMEDYYDYRVTGGKTSSDLDDSRNMVATAKDKGLEYIAIVIRTKPVFDKDEVSIKTYNEFVEMKQLLDLGFSNYVVKQVLFDGQILREYTVPNGTNSVAAGPDRSVVTVLPGGVDLSDLTIRYQNTSTGTLNAPIEIGQRLDAIQVWYGSVCLGQAVLYAMNSADVRYSMEESAGRNMGDGLKTGLIVIGILIGIVVAFFGVLYAIRFVRISMLHKRSRRRRNSRKRSR